MEFSEKKSIKMTTAQQFQKLVTCMEEYPYLATGVPQFGSSKSAMEQTWETVAKKLNSYGPPSRSGNEWKKVWTDIKCRLKKKISDNNKSLHETGGGPCRVNNLTALEQDIDRICHISAAAAPCGKVFGFLPRRKSPPIVLDATPPRTSQNVAVVTPTSTPELRNSETLPKEWEVIDGNFESPPTTTKHAATEPYRMSASAKKEVPRLSSIRKRKHPDGSSEEQERLKLLRQQSEIQAETMEAIKTQAEASQKCVAAMQECTKAIKEQSGSLKQMAESMQLMAKAMCDIVKHLTED